MEETSWKDKDVVKELSNFKNKRRYTIDADKWPDWIKRFNITGLPSVLIVSAKDYKVINRIEGFQDEDQLEAFLKSPSETSIKSGPKSKPKK